MDNIHRTKITVDIKNDPLLCYWAEQASKFGRGYLSNTVRLALEHYITHQSCLEIARLHLPKQDTASERKPLLVFRYSMNPTICSWLDTIKSVGISYSSAIRYVLLNSVIAITDDETEFMINGGPVCEVIMEEVDFGQLLAKTTAKLSHNLNSDRANCYRSFDDTD